MNLLVTVIAFATCLFVLIAVHEFGHYLAGWAAGIPARDMRVRLFVFPQRVELRADNRWIWANEWELFLATDELPMTRVFTKGLSLVAIADVPLGATGTADADGGEEAGASTQRKP